MKDTFDKLQKMHQTINDLNSKSPLLITASHLGLENEKILSLQSSLDYVLDLPFIGADSLVSVELMNTLLIETNTINQAFEKLNVECLSIRQLWSSLESCDKKLCDNLSILSRYFSDGNEPPISWLKPGKSAKIQNLANDCISQVSNFNNQQQTLLQEFNMQVLEKDFVNASKVIVDKRDKWWRMFSSTYRKAKKIVKKASNSGKLPSNQDLFSAQIHHQETDRLTLMLLSDWKDVAAGVDLGDLDVNLIANQINCLQTIDSIRGQGISTQDLTGLFSDSSPNQFSLLDALNNISVANKIINDTFSESINLDLRESINWEVGTLSQNWDEFSNHILQLKEIFDNCDERFISISLSDLKTGLKSIGLIQDNRKMISETIVDTKAKLDGFYSSDQTDWNSNLETLSKISDLIESQNENFTQQNVDSLIRLGPELAGKTQDALNSFDDTVLNYSMIFDEEKRAYLSKIQFEELESQLELQLEEIDTLDGYLRLQQEIQNAKELGVAPILEKFTELNIEKALLPDAFERAFLNKWIESRLEETSTGFDSSSHERERELFMELDQKILDSRCATIMESCNERRPKHRLAFAATINREHEKKRRHLPIRSLVAEGLEFILSLKPCIMMSPLSVSHFLPPIKDLFDVVIFDEASQVRPEEAINCIYRGKQAIIAGDQKQLPPTDFFSRSIEVDDDEEVDDFDSVLDIANAGPGI